MAKLAKSGDKGFGESWNKLFDLSTARIREMTQDPKRMKAANDSMRSVLFDISPVKEIIYPEMSKYEIMEFDVISGFISVNRMIFSLDQCKNYFKKYLFKDIAVSRSDHLRNICEMYFDRIVQFRDRMKDFLNCIKKVSDFTSIEVKEILKIFDKNFRWEIRCRNFTHHHGRFNYLAIERLSFYEIISYDQDIEIAPYKVRTYRKEVKVWIERVERSAEFLRQILDKIAYIILNRSNLSFVKEKVKNGIVSF